MDWLLEATQQIHIPLRTYVLTQTRIHIYTHLVAAGKHKATYYNKRYVPSLHLDCQRFIPCLSTMGLKLAAKLGKTDKLGPNVANPETGDDSQVPGGLSPARFWLLSVG